MSKPITVERIMALQPCWPEEKVRALLGGGLTHAEFLSVLLGLMPIHARWCLSRLLPPAHRQTWGLAAAGRAAGHGSAGNWEEYARLFGTQEAHAETAAGAAYMWAIRRQGAEGGLADYPAEEHAAAVRHAIELLQASDQGDHRE